MEESGHAALAVYNALRAVVSVALVYWGELCHAVMTEKSLAGSVAARHSSPAIPNSRTSPPSV